MFKKVTLISFIFFFSGLSAFASCVIKEVSFDGYWQEEHHRLYREILNEPCSALEKANQTVIEWHENHGFPAAKIQSKISEDGKVKVILVRGEAWVWASPENQGKTKTKKNLWPKITGIEEGKPFSLSEIKKAESQVLRLGYYDKAKETQLYKDGRRNRLIPVFFMKDRPVNHLEGFFSYSSVDHEYSGSIEIALLNMAGTARDLYLEGETGLWGRSLLLKYKEPWLLGSAWSGLIRGMIDEDSLTKEALLEVGVSRRIFEQMELAILGGIGNDEWRTALEVNYLTLDHFILPRSGVSMDASMIIIQKRDSLENALVALTGKGIYLIPIYTKGVLRFSFGAGTLLPSRENHELEDLFSLGGVDSFKGYRNGFFRSRAYGYSECMLEWQAANSTAFQAFYQPGIYRARAPEHGWKEINSYGLGISQYRDRWNISIYYAMNLESSFLEGLLHLNVKTLF
jgi:outer membrane protein assembly factor BamA